MADQQKYILGEWIEVAALADSQGLIDRLTAAARPLDLPALLLERMHMALANAIRRIAQRGSRQEVVVVVASARHPLDGERRAWSWGFFLVEKGAASARQCRIEVLVYPEGG